MGIFLGGRPPLQKVGENPFFIWYIRSKKCLERNIVLMINNDNNCNQNLERWENLESAKQTKFQSLKDNGMEHFFKKINKIIESTDPVLIMEKILFMSMGSQNVHTSHSWDQKWFMPSCCKMKIYNILHKATA